jgi:hypothetical protein
MNDDSRVIDKGWDTLPNYADKAGDTDDAVTVSLSTTPGEWLVNTVDAVVVPMSMAEVVEALQKHKLTERSLVWRAGMQEWAPVDKVPQLKLAARLPSPSASVAPAAPAPGSIPPAASAARPTHSTKPPPKPARATPTPSAAPPAAIALPSRKATLPFGLPNPTPSASHGATPSRPANARPSSSPRAAAPPPAAPPADEQEVLAVYSRPAATVSFDLSPERPLQAASVAPPAPAPSKPPHTLAPLTSDSAPRRMSAAPNADLSVVAAAHFRQVQRSSKRLVVTCSILSAAAASLLTFWLARHGGSLAPPRLAPASAPAAAATLAPPPAPAPAAPAPEVALAPAPAPGPSAALADKPAAVVAAAPAKPKPSRRARVTPRPVPPAASDDSEATTKLPSAEPNPYDVKLDDEAPQAKPVADVARPSLDEAIRDTQSASSSATPGF